MQLNIYELLKWLEENKEKINNAKIKTIHRTYKKGIIIELFKPSLEKKYLYLIPGEVIFLSNTKLKIKTDSFVMKLRKDFSGKNIIINILDFERIVIIEVSNSDKKIIVELFPPGNIIVLDNNIIEYAQTYKDYGVRKVFKGLEYKIPPSNFRIPSDFNEFKEIIRESNKKDLVRCLAIDLRLGKKYSEWLLEGLDKYKKISSNNIPENVLESIWKKYLDFINNKKILLKEWTDQINDTIEKQSLNELEYSEMSKLIKKREKIIKILKSQEESINIVEKKIKEYKLIGDFISTFSWIFNSKNIEDIENKLKNLGLNVKVSREGIKVKIEVDKNEIKKLLGYSE